MEHKIKKMILSYGADVCGISGIERFGNVSTGLECQQKTVQKSAFLFFVKGCKLKRSARQQTQQEICIPSCHGCEHCYTNSHNQTRAVPAHQSLQIHGQRQTLS